MVIVYFKDQKSRGYSFRTIYRIKEGIKQKQLRDNIRQALSDVTIHENG